MTYVKCVQSQLLPVDEHIQPADEIVIKLNSGSTSEDLDQILKRHTQFVFSKEVTKYSNI